MALFQKFNEKVPRRAILGVMCFLACMFSYFLRTNLSIIIVAMVTTGKNQTGALCLEENAIYNNNTQQTSSSSLPDYGERYEWSQHVQGFLLASYFYGVVPASIPSGRIAEKFGGAKVVAFATLIPALLNLLMPYAAGLSFYLVFVLRFLMGFFGAAVYPALHAMIARWVPPDEKGLFVWSMTGGPFGTVVTFALCGAIISTWGWKAAFYTTSGLILVWYVLWVWLIFDTPDAHPTITEKEKAYIKEKIGSTVSKKKTKLPVKHLATSLPFLTLLWSHFANMWGIYFISTNGPKYTLEVLGFNMKSGGALTGLPYICRLFAGAVFAAAGDFCRRKSLLSVTWIRKLFMLFSHVGPAICLIVVTYVGCDGVTAMIMLVLSLTFNGAACQTNLQNHQDLSPNFAGTLYGIMNTFGSFPGFIIPPIVGALTNERNGVEEWRPMFWISSGVFISATLLFWIFGSAEVQKWNDLQEEENSPDEERRMTNMTAKATDAPTSDEEENIRL